MAGELHQSSHSKPAPADLERAPCPHGCVAGDELLHVFDPFRVYRCQACKLVRLDPRLAESKLASLYQDHYFSGSNTTGYDTYEDDKVEYERTGARRLKLIRKYKPSGRLLDIGCGLGYFLNVAESEGFEVYGLDLSSYAVEACRSRFDGRVKQGLLEPDAFPEKMFDVVTMFDLFEHVYHPTNFLSTLHSIMKPDGIVVITTPNHRSVLSRVSGRRWVSYKLPEHVYYYTPDTLSKMVKPFFTVETVQSAGQYCSLQFLTQRVKNLNQSVGRVMSRVVNSMGIGELVVYVNSGSMTTVLRKAT